MKAHLVHDGLTKQQISYTYAEEADLINVALFGMTAKEWRDRRPEASGNMRDEASITELVVLSNMEAMNAEMIRQGQSQARRLVALRKIAAYQIQTLQGNNSIGKIGAVLLPKKD